MRRGNNAIFKFMMLIAHLRYINIAVKYCVSDGKVR